MTGTTPFLALTKPGGGSTGLITPPDRVDIDVINSNSDKIDAFANTTDSRLDTQEARNQQFRGTEAARPSVSGMKRGDFYQDTDGGLVLWKYTNAWEPVPGLVLAHGYSNDTTTQSIPNATDTVATFAAQRFNGGFTYTANGFVVPFTGWYQFYYFVTFAGNATGTRVVKLQRNGATPTEGEFTMTANPTGSSITALNMVARINMTAGDRLNVVVSQSSGGALNIAQRGFGLEFLFV